MKKLYVNLEITFVDSVPSDIPCTKDELEKSFIQMVMQETDGVDKVKATIVGEENLCFKD